MHIFGWYFLLYKYTPEKSWLEAKKLVGFPQKAPFREAWKSEMDRLKSQRNGGSLGEPKLVGDFRRNPKSRKSLGEFFVDFVRHQALV